MSCNLQMIVIRLAIDSISFYWSIVFLFGHLFVNWSIVKNRFNWSIVFLKDNKNKRPYSFVQNEVFDALFTSMQTNDSSEKYKSALIKYDKNITFRLFSWLISSKCFLLFWNLTLTLLFSFQIQFSTRRRKEKLKD